MPDIETGKFTALEAKGVSARRGGRTIFEDVDLSLRPGGALILRGPNGAGKTTLLRCLAGIARTSTGTIRLTGADGDLTLAGAVAFLGHLNGVKTALTVHENLQFWTRIYNAPQASAHDASQALGVTELSSQTAAALSAGQRRRLALCRLLISRRPVWLLDEPTSGMDAASIAAVERIISDHRQQGGGVVVATHEPLQLTNAETVMLVTREFA